MITHKNQKGSVLRRLESGRSMVEIFAVLAMIAVLSVGGIVGYQFAMTKYVANNIAHEINLTSHSLRFMLEQPRKDDIEPYLSESYDEGEIKTGSYPFEYGCGMGEVSNFTCSLEEEYFYEIIRDLPKGVCRQLAQLTQGMDFWETQKVNGEYDVTGEYCTEDKNEFLIVFNLEGVVINTCATDSDCPSSRCLDGVCEPCPEEAPYWDGAECVSCLKNRDCPDSAKPFCSEIHICDVCPPETPIWNGVNCVACQTNADCTLPTEPLCQNHSCTSCPPEKPIWTGTECIECETNPDCFDPAKPVCNSANVCESCPEEEPIWDGESCIACPEGTDCSGEPEAESICDPETPKWNEETKSCEACPPNTYWDAETNACGDSSCYDQMIKAGFKKVEMEGPEVIHLYELFSYKKGSVLDLSSCDLFVEQGGRFHDLSKRVIVRNLTFVQNSETRGGNLKVLQNLEAKKSLKFVRFKSVKVGQDLLGGDISFSQSWFEIDRNIDVNSLSLSQSKSCSVAGDRIKAGSLSLSQSGNFKALNASLDVERDVKVSQSDGFKLGRDLISLGNILFSQSKSSSVGGERIEAGSLSLSQSGSFKALNASLDVKGDVKISQSGGFELGRNLISSGNILFIQSRSSSVGGERIDGTYLNVSQSSGFKALNATVDVRRDVKVSQSDSCVVGKNLIVTGAFTVTQSDSGSVNGSVNANTFNLSQSKNFQVLGEVFDIRNKSEISSATASIEGDFTSNSIQVSGTSSLSVSGTFSVQDIGSKCLKLNASQINYCTGKVDKCSYSHLEQKCG